MPNRLIIALAVLVAVGGGCGKRVPHGDRPWAQVKVVVRSGADPLAQGEVAFLAVDGSAVSMRAVWSMPRAPPRSPSCRATTRS